MPQRTYSDLSQLDWMRQGTYGDRLQGYSRDALIQQNLAERRGLVNQRAQEMIKQKSYEAFKNRFSGVNSYKDVLGVISKEPKWMTGPAAPYVKAMVDSSKELYDIETQAEEARTLVKRKEEAKAQANYIEAKDKYDSLLRQKELAEQSELAWDGDDKLLAAQADFEVASERAGIVVPKEKKSGPAASAMEDEDNAVIAWDGEKLVGTTGPINTVTKPSNSPIASKKQPVPPSYSFQGSKSLNSGGIIPPDKPLGQIGIGSWENKLEGSIYAPPNPAGFMRLK